MEQSPQSSGPGGPQDPQHPAGEPPPAGEPRPPGDEPTPPQRDGEGRGAGPGRRPSVALVGGGLALLVLLLTLGAFFGTRAFLSADGDPARQHMISQATNSSI